MTQHSPVLSTANISWQDGTPFNLDFNDYYYSKSDAANESNYVFVEANRLMQRWQDLEKLKNSNFNILETGFGTGLNFFNTAEHWLRFQEQQKPVHLKELNYTSIEGFPLNQDDLKQIINSWQVRYSLTDSLVEHYPAAIKGQYCFDFGSVELKLILMPLDKALGQFEPKGKPFFDCVYLDGFSPSKNKSIWNPTLLRQLSYFCKPGSSISTYTSASSVRTTLTSIGYEIKKTKGFGLKREMLVGTFSKQGKVKYKSKTPWFETTNQLQKENKAIIIGAGVTGCATAYALNKQGITCTLIDNNSQPGGTIHDFRKSIYSSNLTADFNSISQFYWHSYCQLNQYLSQHCEIDHNRCGVFLVADTPKRFDMLKAAHDLLNSSGMNIRWLEPEQTRLTIGLQINYPGLFNEHGGWLNIKSFCNSLVNKVGISTKFNTQVLSIEQTRTGWCIQTNNTQMHSDCVVLCGGASLNLIENYNLCRLDKTQGQTTLIKQTTPLFQSNTIVNNGHYLIPNHQNSEYFVGSNYDRYTAQSYFPRIEADIKNLSSVIGLNENLSDCLNAQIKRLSKLSVSTSTMGMRLTSRDHLPIIGPMPDMNFYTQRYPEYIKTGRLKNCPDAAYLGGLFVNTAHGSRGITASLLSAEIMAAIITNQQLPVPTNLYQAIHPARFFVRDQLASK